LVPVILTEDGHLDLRLRNIVFSDRKAVLTWKALTHPAMAAAGRGQSPELVASTQSLVLPLRVYKNLGSQLNRVLVVDCVKSCIFAGCKPATARLWNRPRHSQLQPLATRS